MNNLEFQSQMLVTVAQALGPQLCNRMIFVGGCTTGLLLTDPFTMEQVRHTDDVDLIVHVMGYTDYINLQDELGQSGFRIAMPEDDDAPPVCAMHLGDLRVDIMPDDSQVLGFTNRWYADAIQSATPFILPDGTSIQLVSPVYFIATKLEAYNGRGKDDALTSRDIEDIIHLIDGRPELGEEISASDAAVKSFISSELASLIHDNNFEMAVSSQAGDQGREEVIFERLEDIIAKGRS